MEPDLKRTTELKFTKFESEFFENIDYVKSLDIQEEKIYQVSRQAQALQSNKELKALSPELVILLGFEYPATITLGKRAFGVEHINQSHSLFEQQKIFIFESSRGGQATLHSPGQLVIYPILRLGTYKLTIRSYVRLLEKVTIQFFESYGVKALFHEDDSGVYLPSGEKIAFIGLKIHQGVTSHGIAINISNQLELFDLIVSCGIKNRPVSSMKKEGVEVRLLDAFKNWAQLFEESLNKQ